ncbi:hypothetical protein BDP27DRAFT_1424693 [Rhodocollybia butyracea]|uniref:Uncharacterized protein n=1 Tax=Rhodocollybia butyracea TaxID=206335 RepID=A0A9P5U4F6_9AGAR|nr:hypothetical protein BDP27DRAFT_1424693 [Rhodocollybia butyracea]
MQLYPEVSNIVSETWQASKWLDEADLDDLTPMWANWNSTQDRHCHYFIKELASTCDRNFVLLQRWVAVNGVMHVDVLSIAASKMGDALTVTTCNDDSMNPQVPVSQLACNILDLQISYPGGIYYSEYIPDSYKSSSPLRKISKGQPMFRQQVVAWSDNVSGNVNKQYNAHTNVYVTNPHFPHSSSLEQFVALCNNFKDDKWITTYDSKLEEEILIQLKLHFLPADNPQQSETASHIGVNGNLNCRADLMGGPDAFKESKEGYEALYHPGIPRTVESTIQCI